MLSIRQDRPRRKRPPAAARALAALVICALLLACGRPEAVDEPPAVAPEESKTALDRYVAAPDPAYSYELLDTREGDGFSTHVLEMTSQTWLGQDIVDRPLWKHWLTVVRPDRIETERALLFIGGGDNDDSAPSAANPLLVEIALASSAVTAELHMIPNQPLTFAGDDRPRVEDELIAFGWHRYLRGGDPKWLARLPMTKAAVRAMDTITDFCASAAGGELQVDRYVVSGGSKRGWTTWTTAVVDERVIAIAPIVIDLLNIVPSFEHHYRAYGFWAPAVGDYEREGIMDWLGHERYSQLLAIVDPYSYLRRLELPKFIINAAGDQFFLPDSSQFYWHDLRGDKYLRYVPNADHSLDGSDAGASLTAFFEAIVNDQQLPRVNWTVSGDRLRVTVDLSNPPSDVRLWQASNDSARDFRLETIGPGWTDTELALDRDGVAQIDLEAPAVGWAAYLIELTYPGPWSQPLRLTTEVEIRPEELPYEYPPTESEPTSERDAA